MACFSDTFLSSRYTFPSFFVFILSVFVVLSSSTSLLFFSSVFVFSIVLLCMFVGLCNWIDHDWVDNLV
ncbi:hypothetical protein K438DRAFT_90709 [Mycena galopus ATCC 62051]|nr:hypothetical protein K438DRAFT_90709 [Mycena galopus ATCC 62051]